MATAEKEVAEQASGSPNVRLALGSLQGAAFVLFSLYMVLAGLPYLWMEGLSILEGNPFLSGALLILVEIGAIVGLVFLGRRLEGSNPPHGLRAGIFFLCVAVLAIFWLVTKVSWMFAGQGVVLSLAATILVGGGLFILVMWLFLKPRIAAWLRNREDKGWFHATPYKANQGLRVRRCTVVALLVLGLYGIFTMSKGLGSDRTGPNKEVISNDWRWHIPFLGEAGVFFGAQYDNVNQGTGIKITDVEPRSPAEKAGLQKGDVITKVDDKVLNNAKNFGEILDRTLPVEVLKLQTVRQDVAGKDETLEPRVLLASGHPAFPVLYKVQFTLPILFVVLLVWLSWRIINLPGFGDFLIATEAEMNKVSWTTGKRLKQDTIVVLVTVFILAAFLFVIDIVWIKVLSHPWVRVLSVDIKTEALKQQEKTQW